MLLNNVCCALIALFHAVGIFAAQPLTPVTALVIPQKRYSPVAVHEMIREADHILKHSGVVLHSQVGEMDKVVNGLLVVVKLRGNCDMDGPVAILEPGPLGWSYEADGVILPFSDLACDMIRNSVQSVLPGNPLAANVLLGRAMGRVLAHELYHIVADTSRHGQSGVGQASLSPRELTRGPLELQPSEVEAMQAGLDRGR